MRKIIFINIFLAIFYCSCSRHKTIENNAQKIELSTPLEKSLVDTVCFKSATFVPLETNNNSLLRTIDRICIDDDRLFVFDKSLNKLVVFDLTGKYLAHIHRIGNAPSEYVGVMDFCLDVKNKQVIFLCDKPYKMMRFSYDGEFLSETTTAEFYDNIIHIGEGFCCNRSELSSEKSGAAELVFLDENLQIKSETLPMRTEINNPVFYAGKFLTSTLNNYYTRRFDNIIYQITNGEVVAKYEIDFKEYALSTAAKETLAAEDNMRPKAKFDYVYSISDVAESHHFLLFKTNLGLFVYDKQTGALSAHKTIYNSKIKNSNNNYFAIGNCSQYVASMLGAAQLNQLKTLAAKIPDFNNFELLDLAKNVDLEDNPILILYEFKE